MQGGCQFQIFILFIIKLQILHSEAELLKVSECNRFDYLNLVICSLILNVYDI